MESCESHSGLVLCDASNVIGLDQIGHLALLHRLFGAVTIPEAVAREIMPTVARPSWMVVRVLSQPLGARTLQYSLGAGEGETIALALEVKARYVVLDDRPARRLAVGLGLPVIGTAGVLLLAKEAGLVAAVRPLLESLRRNSFHMSPSFYSAVLRTAGEE